MKKSTICIALFCLVSVAAFAQRGMKAIPAGVDLERYPIFSQVLTTSDQAKLGLRPMTLDQPWTGYNWYGKDQRFVLETLQPGTMVLADKNGNPVYKADCGNRLASIQACPLCAPAKSSGAMSYPAIPQKGFLDRLWDAVGSAWKLIGGLALLALALLVLAALLYALYRLLRFLFEGRRSTEEGRAFVPASPVVPPPTPIAEIAPLRAHAAAAGASPTAAAVAPAPIPTVAPARSASGPAVAPTSTDDPTPQLQRRFVACYAGTNPQDEVKVRHAGCKFLVVEQTPEDSEYTTTIRFR